MDGHLGVTSINTVEACLYLPQVTAPHVSKQQSRKKTIPENFTFSSQNLAANPCATNKVSVLLPHYTSQGPNC